MEALRQGPTRRMKTNPACDPPARRKEGNLGEVPDPTLLRASFIVRCFSPGAAGSLFLQGRKDQRENLRERTKLAPSELPSSRSWDYLEGWHFFLS